MGHAPPQYEERAFRACAALPVAAESHRLRSRHEDTSEDAPASAPRQEKNAWLALLLRGGGQHQLKVAEDARGPSRRQSVNETGEIVPYSS
eukprot:3276126-Rhodomonas_salina.1